MAEVKIKILNKIRLTDFVLGMTIERKTGSKYMDRKTAIMLKILIHFGVIKIPCFYIRDDKIEIAVVQSDSTATVRKLVTNVKSLAVFH